MWALVIVVVALGLLISKVQSDNLFSRMEQAVRARGGTPLRCVRPFFRRGPFWFAGKGQVVGKVIYRDASGRLRQVWGRTGGFLFGDALNWEYDDGDNDLTP